MARQKNPLLSTEKYKAFKQLAKRADQRLVRLEKLQKEEGFENVLKFAYKRATKDIEKWGLTKEGKQFRFNVRPKSEEQLDKMMKDVERFLSSKTTTKKDIINVYDSKRNALKEAYGVDLTWQEIALYFETGFAKKYDKTYASKTALKAIAVIQQSKAKTYQELKSAVDTMKVLDDDVANEEALKLMRYYKKDLKKVGVV